MMRVIGILLFAVLTLALAPAVTADDWVAVKLRGEVFEKAPDGWRPLQRGDVVSDQRRLATGANGHVVLQRDGETIDVGPGTQFSIVDKYGRRFTTVKLAVGEVSIEANVENVEHFAVETAWMAAVVKGTRFTVATGKGGSEVSVNRGHVEVTDHGTGQRTTLGVGQKAVVSRGGLEVSGSGKLPPVVDSRGRPVAYGGASDHGGASAGFEAGAPGSERGGTTPGAGTAIFVTGPSNGTAGGEGQGTSGADNSQSGSNGNGQGNSGVGLGNGGGNGTGNEGNGKGAGNSNGKSGR